MSNGPAPSRPPAPRALVCLLAAAALALAMPAGALAAGIEGGNSFNELSQKAQEQEQTAPKTTSRNAGSSGEPSNTGKTIVIGTLAGVVLIGAIAFAIIRDVRRVAPAGEAELIERRAASDQAVRMRNRRSKAKAARKQRKRNR